MNVQTDIAVELLSFQVKPKPTVTWLRDGKEITSDDHFQLSHAEDGTLQLKIITTKMEDKSRITIKAENYFGTAGLFWLPGITTSPIIFSTDSVFQNAPPRWASSSSDRWPSQRSKATSLRSTSPKATLCRRSS